MPKISVFAGQTYTRLKVLKRVENDKRGRPLFLCRCSCKDKTLVTVASNALRTRNTRSCGCLKWELATARIRSNWQKPKGMAAAWALFKSYLHGAARRHIAFSLIFDDFMALCGLPCHYCGALPERQTHVRGVNGQFVYNGLDLVFKEMGYTKETVVTCCWQCNRARRALPVPEFLAHIALIHEHSIRNSKI